MHGTFSTQISETRFMVIVPMSYVTLCACAQMVAMRP